MLPNRYSHNVFTVFALLAVLVLASLPAQARPVRHAVAVSGDNGLSRIWSFLGSLWPQGTKEGTSIDPNGAPKPQGMTTAPSDGTDDEGMSIDPNGRT